MSWLAFICGFAPFQQALGLFYVRVGVCWISNSQEVIYLQKKYLQVINISRKFTLHLKYIIVIFYVFTIKLFQHIILVSSLALLLGHLPSLGFPQLLNFQGTLCLDYKWNLVWIPMDPEWHPNQEMQKDNKLLKTCMQHME